MYSLNPPFYYDENGILHENMQVIPLNIPGLNSAVKIAMEKEREKAMAELPTRQPRVEFDVEDGFPVYFDAEDNRITEEEYKKRVSDAWADKEEASYTPDTRTGVIRNHYHAYGVDGICITEGCIASHEEKYPEEPDNKIDYGWKPSASVWELEKAENRAFQLGRSAGIGVDVSQVIEVETLARIAKEHGVMISFNITPKEFEEDDEDAS